jgi:predicted GIY-YIG superfamily endonuclease
MPKHPIDLSNVFFMRSCKDLTITDRYVGSTTNLVKRRYNHNPYVLTKTIHHNTYVYQFIRKNGVEQLGGYEIENDKNDVLKRERYWLEERGDVK